MTTPRCAVCGHFIGWYDLDQADSVYCCEDHRWIKSCGACLELFEKYGTAKECIIDSVRTIKKRYLNEKDYPRYACPNCDYVSYSFTAAANHMATNNHLYQGVGTYTIFIAPSKHPRVSPNNKFPIPSINNQEVSR